MKMSQRIKNSVQVQEEKNKNFEFVGEIIKFEETTKDGFVFKKDSIDFRKEVPLFYENNFERLIGFCSINIQDDGVLINKGKIFDKKIIEKLENNKPIYSFSGYKNKEKFELTNISLNMEV